MTVCETCLLQLRDNLEMISKMLEFIKTYHEDVRQLDNRQDSSV